MNFINDNHMVLTYYCKTKYSLPTSYGRLKIEFFQNTTLNCSRRRLCRLIHLHWPDAFPANIIQHFDHHFKHLISDLDVYGIVFKRLSPLRLLRVQNESERRGVLSSCSLPPTDHRDIVQAHAAIMTSLLHGWRQAGPLVWIHSRCTKGNLHSISPLIAVEDMGQFHWRNNGSRTASGGVELNLVVTGFGVAFVTTLVQAEHALHDVILLDRHSVCAPAKTSPPLNPVLFTLLPHAGRIRQVDLRWRF